MGIFGLFNSSSKTDRRSTVSERTNINTASGSNSKIFSNNLGGITVTGGGKKSRTSVINNIQFTDFGAIKSGETVALAALDQNRGAFDGALEFANQALDFGETGLERGFGLVGKNTAAAVSDGMNKVLLFGAFAVGAFVFVSYMKGK